MAKRRLKTRVGIVMGSESDRGAMEEAARVLEEFEVGSEVVVRSAHRTPDATAHYAKTARGRGFLLLQIGTVLADQLGATARRPDRSRERGRPADQHEEVVGPAPLGRHHELVVDAHEFPGDALHLGRLDDERDIVVTDQAGTATRPLRVQRLHPETVEVVDHLPHPVLGGLDQLGDHRHRVPTRRRQNHHRPPVTDHTRLALPLTPADQPLKPPTLIVGKPTHTNQFSHTDSLNDQNTQAADHPGVPVRSGH